MRRVDDGFLHREEVVASEVPRLEGDGLLRRVDFRDFADVADFGAHELEEPSRGVLLASDKAFRAQL